MKCITTSRIKLVWCNFRPLLTFLLMMTLAACESRLALENVVEQQNKPLQRTDLFQAATANDEVLVTVGSYGVIVVSNDMGQSWQRQKLPSQPSLIDIDHCPDGSLAALAMEGQVWVSQDNGDSWEERDMGTREVPQALICDPSGRLWVVASFSTILSSSDLGISWEIQSFDEDMILSHIQFFSPSEGLLTGEFGTLALTRDGGKTWHRSTPVPAEFNPMTSLFLDMEHGWVAGLNGTVFHTSDGGNSWDKQATDTSAPLYRMVQGAGKIYVAGDFGILLEYSEASDTQDNSNNSGRWVKSQVDIGTRSFIRAVQTFPNGTLLVGGGGGMLKVIKPDLGNEG